MEDRMLCLCLQMLRMSTGHMEGDLQPLYLLLTDCYIYLLRKGNQHKKNPMCIGFHCFVVFAEAFSNRCFV